MRKKVENAARNVPNATLIDEDERWSDTDLVFDFVESICEIQSFESRLPSQRFICAELLQSVYLCSVLIVEENLDVMTAFFDFTSLRQEFGNQDKRAAWFTPRVLTRAAKEIKELQRFSAEIISVKKDLEPGSDVTSIDLELRLCPLIEGFDV